MNIKKAKQILKENGYMAVPSRVLRESFSRLRKHGFMINEEEEEDSEGFKEDDDDEGDDEGKSVKKPRGEDKSDLEEIIKALKDKKDYTAYVQALSGLNRHQAKLLRYLIGDGAYSKDVKVSKGNIPVKLLHPTQQEIDVNNSLAYPLKKNPAGPPSLSEIVSTEGPFTINESPIIVYKHGSSFYIIDGHHRWSQIFLLNPKAKMKCILYSAPEGTDETPVEMLRDFQLVIKAVTGKVKIADADSKFNIYTMSEKAIRNYVIETCTDEAVKEYKKAKEDATKESIADYIVENGKNLKSNNGPADGAPRRNVMPQTDDTTLKVAAQGMTDI